MSEEHLSKIESVVLGSDDGKGMLKHLDPSTLATEVNAMETESLVIVEEEPLEDGEEFVDLDDKLIQVLKS